MWDRGGLNSAPVPNLDPTVKSTVLEARCELGHAIALGFTLIDGGFTGIHGGFMDPLERQTQIDDKVPKSTRLAQGWSCFNSLALAHDVPKPPPCSLSDSEAAQCGSEVGFGRGLEEVMDLKADQNRL